MLSKIGFLSSPALALCIAPQWPYLFQSLDLSPPLTLFPPPPLWLCFIEGGRQAGRSKKNKELIGGAAWEGVASTYPLVPFEGVPQLTKDGLVGLAGPSLKKEDS